MNEEVKEEIEALMSIYEDDMEVLEESPNYVISMNVRSMNEPEDVPSMLLKLTYPADYPETSPLQIVRNTRLNELQLNNNIKFYVKSNFLGI